MYEADVLQEILSFNIVFVFCFNAAKFDFNV